MIFHIPNRSLVHNRVLLELDLNTRLRHIASVTALPQHIYKHVNLHVPLPRDAGAPRAYLHILLPPGQRWKWDFWTLKT